MPSVQAIDLDPGDGGGEPQWYIRVEIQYVKMAKDGDLFNAGEIYIDNPGDDIWSAAEAASWEGDYWYNTQDHLYYPKIFTVPVSLVYEKALTPSDIGTKLWFKLMDDNPIIDDCLWSGYIKIQDFGSCSFSTYCKDYDYGPLKLVYYDSAICYVGLDIQIRNNLHFKVEYVMYDF